MSDLNLIPNPQLMFAQALVFFSQVYVVNKFLVVPFARLKKLRSRVTVGADLKADELMREIKVVSGEIHTYLAKTQEDIKKIKEVERLDAKKIRDLEIAQAQKEMTDLISVARKNIQKDLQEERKKIQGSVSGFVDEIYAKLCR